MTTTAGMRGGLAVTVVLAVIAILIALSTGEAQPHAVYAEFEDAGQLVGGDLVTVSGHQIGTVQSIGLTPSGLASVKLEIDDPGIWPLRVGTQATVQELSLTAVANRYVALQLAPSGPAIPQDGTIGSQYTHGIVDLDVLIDSLTPQIRRSLVQLVKAGADVVGGGRPAQFNDALYYVNPALSQLTGIASQVVSDRFALDRLVASAARVSSAVSLRALDLDNAIRQTSTWLHEAGSERTALADAVRRAPGVLAQSAGTLGTVSRVVKQLDPVLHDLRPTARPFARLVGTTTPALSRLVPAIEALQIIADNSRATLAALPAVVRTAVPALNSATSSFANFLPIISGVRPYTPDLVSSFFSLLASAGAGYDANGGYARGNPVVVGSPSELSGALALVAPTATSIPALDGGRTGLLAACPGAAEGSPWTSPDTLPAAGVLCNPADDQH